MSDQFSLELGPVLMNDLIEQCSFRTKEEKLSDTTFKTKEKLITPEDFMLNMEQSPDLPIFHNNTNLDVLAAGREYGNPEKFFAELGTLFVKMKEEISESDMWGYDELKKENLFFAGVSIDKQYGGLHLKLPYKAVFINPLYNWNAKTLFGVRENFLDTMIHELAHTSEMDHGVGHNQEMLTIRQYLADQSTLDYYRDTLLDILTRHESAFTAMRDAYGRSSIKNTAKSLEDYGENSSQASTRNTKSGSGNPPATVPARTGSGGGGNLRGTGGNPGSTPNPGGSRGANQQARALERFKQKAGHAKDTRSAYERIKDYSREGFDYLKTQAADTFQLGVLDKYFGTKRAYRKTFGGTGEGPGYMKARMATGTASTMTRALLEGTPEFRDSIVTFKPSSKGLLQILERVWSRFPGHI